MYYASIIIWLVFVGDISRALIGLLSLLCRALFSRNAHGPITGLRTIGCKVITSAALALAFGLFLCAIK